MKVKDLREILKDIDWDNLWVNADDIYKKEILDDVEDWLSEESDKQNFIEENLRNDLDE